MNVLAQKLKSAIKVNRNLHLKKKNVDVEFYSFVSPAKQKRDICTAFPASSWKVALIFLCSGLRNFNGSSHETWVMHTS